MKDGETYLSNGLQAGHNTDGFDISTTTDVRNNSSELISVRIYQLCRLQRGRLRRHHLWGEYQRLQLLLRWITRFVHWIRRREKQQYGLADYIPRFNHSERAEWSTNQVQLRHHG